MHCSLAPAGSSYPWIWLHAAQILYRAHTLGSAICDAEYRSAAVRFLCNGCGVEIEEQACFGWQHMVLSMAYSGCAVIEYMLVQVEDAAKDVVAEEHPDNIGKRIAAQWTSDPEAAGDTPPPDEDSSEPEANAAGVDASNSETGDTGSETDSPKSMFDRLKGAAKSIKTAFGSGSTNNTATPVDTVALEKAQAAVKELTEASKRAVEAHNANSGELRDMEAKLKSAQLMLANVRPAPTTATALALACSKSPLPNSACDTRDVLCRATEQTMCMLPWLRSASSCKLKSIHTRYACMLMQHRWRQGKHHWAPSLSVKMTAA